MIKYAYNYNDPILVKATIWLAKKNNLPVGPKNYHFCLSMSLRNSSEFREEFTRLWWIEYGSLLHFADYHDPKSEQGKAHVIWPDERDLVLWILRWS
jgi:hypothetical protein